MLDQTLANISSKLRLQGIFIQATLIHWTDLAQAAPIGATLTRATLTHVALNAALPTAPPPETIKTA